MKNVCLDLDEVLADMGAGLCRSFGRDQSYLDAETEFNFEKIYGRSSTAFNDFTAEWWWSLPPTRWKDAVVDFALACADDGWDSIHVVTALPMKTVPAAIGRAAEGKIEWCRKHLPEIPSTRIIFAFPKPLLARGDTILIDDFSPNLEGFGANAVLIPSRWNGLRNRFAEFRQDPAAFLASTYGHLLNSRNCR